ncbi:MAG TPA: serine hydrolase domain-containing protein, partial [Candidatus Binatia bacterium]|nr:serine hydrolase domain-containing protein [Candidatus Binatia bacterium]
MTTFTMGRTSAIGALALCLFLAGCKTSAPKSGAKTPKVDQFFARWDHADSPGAAVVVVKNGAVVYQHGYGSANLESRVPITPQTAFDAASVAKQFTGLSIAMLIEQGKLSLDDDIRKHRRDVPDFGHTITIRHLLYHTSGLRDWPETLGLSGFGDGAIITLDTTLEMVRRQQELDFVPGEEQQYCNTSYNLLAAAIAKVSGKSFREWTDANLFEPLGMKHTHFCEDPTKLIPNRAESYSPAGEKKYNRNLSELAAQGSSSLFITAEDMGKWLINFQTERVGGRNAFGRMYEPGKLNGGKKLDFNYGFGVVLGDYHGARMISHGGAWAGYRSFVLHIPEKQFGVAILSNTSDMREAGIATKIADLYLGHSSPAKKPAAPATNSIAAGKIEPTLWDAYLGTYRLGSGWLLEITREGDHLNAQATHEDKFKMTPVSDTTFFVQAYGASVEFVRSKSGPTTHLLYKGIRAPRLELSKPTPTSLQVYVGDYWSEELRVAYRVEIRDGELGGRDRSGTWVRLLPTGPDR